MLKRLHTLTAEVVVEEEVLYRFGLGVANGTSILLHHPHSHKPLLCFESIMVGEPNHEATSRNDSSIPHYIYPTHFICDPQEIFVDDFNGIFRGFHPAAQLFLYPAEFFDHPSCRDRGVEKLPSPSFYIHFMYPFNPERVLL